MAVAVTGILRGQLRQESNLYQNKNLHMGAVFPPTYNNTSAKWRGGGGEIKKENPPPPHQAKISFALVMS